MIKKISLLLGFLVLFTGCAQATSNEDQATTEDITVADIEAAQANWAQALIDIGEASLESDEAAKAQANETLDTLYAFNRGPVLFKPTKASEVPFRLTKDAALSYFVGGNISEDTGFALEPWTNIRFENAETIINGNTALASGVYFFTSGKTNEEVRVEYTFGYIQDEEGNLLIQLQHSSIPFS